MQWKTPMPAIRLRTELTDKLEIGKVVELPESSVIGEIRLGNHYQILQHVAFVRGYEQSTKKYILDVMREIDGN